MAEGGVFISYRRADSQWAAARVNDALRAALPDVPVFMDVDEIAPGQDFARVLDARIDACDVCLALIGPGWLARDETGARRIDDPADFVRQEIAGALARGETLTIPVLLDDARLPDAEDLPEDLRPLAGRQFLRLSHESFRRDMGRLAEAVRGAVPERAPPPALVRAQRKRLSGRALAVAAGALCLLAAAGFGYRLATAPPDPSDSADLAGFRECAACPEMIALPPGVFTMGSPEDEPHRAGDEGPQRPVAIARFALSRTEITAAEWRACVADGGCAAHNLPDWGHPAETTPAGQITWRGAQAYAAWLNTKVPGEPYRLPTEAEWEYAARAGSTTAYFWGAAPDRAYANMGREVCCTGAAEGPDEWVGAAPVARFRPNAFGLYDMSGNLWEWVEDHYISDYGTAPADGAAHLLIVDVETRWNRRRAIRGGSYADYPWISRSASRQSNDEERLNGNYGLRIARDLAPR